jgi:superfamily II DNA or RNA helicase
VSVSLVGDGPVVGDAGVGDGPGWAVRSGSELPRLRGYQVRAVDAIVAGLAAGGRGQLVAACGSGKSLVAVYAALRLCPGGVVMLSCPSLALVAQSLQVWVRAAVVDVLAVCSDDTVADAAVGAADLSCPVTTDAAEVAEWLRLGAVGRLRLILVTHISAGVAGAGLAKADTVADLLVVDEAHRTAGAAGKTFAQVHEDGFVAASRRLYMTATPRVLAAGRRGGGDERAVLSMDDERVFGPVLFRYSFAAAIEEGWLDDYQVVAIGVTRQEVLRLLRDADPHAVAAPGEAPLRTVVVQAALLRAAAQFGLRRVLVFTPRVVDSAEFARSLARTAGQLPQSQRPAGTLTAIHVDGTQPVDQRMRALRLLADPPEGGWTVLSCSRCLSEGVDVPAVDGIVFARPKRSEVDAVQGVGRGLRRHPDGSGMATVLVPVLLGDDPHAAADDLGEWATLWQVLRALRAHDGRLAAALDTQRGQVALGEPPQIPARVRLLLPDGYQTADLLAHITVRLIENTTPAWAAGHAALAAFRAQHGHVRVPRPYRVGDLDLANWLRYQLQLHRAGTLAGDRADALRAVGVDLSTADYWERGLAAARAFHAEHGHLHPPVDLVVGGVNLYDWLKGRRVAHKAGRLDPAHDQSLTAMDPTWRQTRHRSTWQEGLAAIAAFHAENGHLRLTKGTVVDGVDVYDWLTRRRRHYLRGTLPAEQAGALDAINPDWVRRTKVDFAVGLAAATAFHTGHGHLRVPMGLRINGIGLQAWLAGIRRKYHAGELSAPQIQALERLGILWSTADSSWQRGLAAATAYQARNGHLRVPRQHREDGVTLNSWLQRQGKKHAKGQLPADHLRALDHLGWRTPTPD